jgi:hypothetical protein
MKRIASLHHLMSSRPVPKKPALVIKTSGELRHRHGEENYLQAIVVSPSYQSSMAWYAEVQKSAITRGACGESIRR